MPMNKNDFTYWLNCLDEIWREQMAFIHKGKDIDQAAKEAYGYLICDPVRLQLTEPADFKRLVNGWLCNKKFPNQQRFQKPAPKLLDLTNL